jgi:N-acyl-D-amino-acid deacylase
MKRFFVALLALALPAQAADVLLTNAIIYDGTGNPGYRGSLRVQGNKIVAVGPKLKVRPGETLRNVRGLAVAPGFIDMHSHASGRIFENPTADNVIRQGIATILVGQDGGSNYPLADFFSQLAKQPTAVNIASMVGHATLRRQVMKPDALRASTPEELEQMKTLLQQELDAGAFGLSTGLEYADAYSATTEEVIALSQIAAQKGGFYLSHVREEGNKVFDSFAEIVTIGEGGKLPVQITHIKLGTFPVWHQAATKVPAVFAEARRRNVNLKADVYPYTFWQSTLRSIVADRDYFNAPKVELAIRDNGGAQGIRLTTYEPDPSVVGMSLQEISTKWQMTPTETFMKIVRDTEPGADGKDKAESVIAVSMSEDDVKWFIAQPNIMFCTDGSLKGSHPRGAGAFPRILGKYVRQEKVLSLPFAIHKMTALAAQQLGLADRGLLRKGYIADIVIFDPKRVIDRATIQDPQAAPEGIPALMVNGEWVLDQGKVTGVRSGVVLTKKP